VSCLTKTIEAVIEDVRAAADALNELDGRAGDGDLGVTMQIAARSVEDALPDLADASVDEVLQLLGTTVALKAPSTAGSLIATGLLRAAGTRPASSASDAEDFTQRLEAACAGIADRGKAEAGSKTMLDALIPAAGASRASVDEGGDVPRALAAAAEAADAGARDTVSMTPRHGRAGWLVDRAVGHEDAGARLVAIMLASAAASVRGRAS
jgi:dihydroxyacetone kinase-like protein